MHDSQVSARKKSLSCLEMIAQVVHGKRPQDTTFHPGDGHTVMLGIYR
jgi:hypothetical protein